MKSIFSRVGMAGSEWSQEDQHGKLFLDWHVAGIAVAVFAAYYAGCKIGFALTFQPHPVEGGARFFFRLPVAAQTEAGALA